MAKARAGSPVIHLDSPVTVAIFPSRDMAALTVTKGVRRTIQWLNASLSCPHSRARTPCVTERPARRRMREAPPGVARIGIGRAGHHPPDAGGDDRFRARRRAALRATRFESDVERGVFGIVSPFLRVADGFDFRVRLSRLPMPALADDLPAPDQHRADQRIGRSPPISAPRQSQGQPHEFSVRKHHLAKSIAVKTRSA